MRTLLILTTLASLATLGAAEEPVAGLILEDPPQPLPPERRRGEAEEDRVEALARFAAGRSLEWNDRLAEALRQYQRAWRYDPQSKETADAAVRLAIRLDRLDEAARIALKVQHPETLNVYLWMKLGVHLSKKGDFGGAARMYENALAARRGLPPSPGEAALRLELGRIRYALEQYPEAAECFVHVRKALENPQAFGLDEDSRREVLGQPALIHLVMGRCFLRAGRLDEAAAAFQQAHRLEPNPGLLGYNMAEVEAQRGRLDEALASLQNYFEQRLSAEGVAPYRLFEQVLEGLGRENELVGRLEKLRAEDAENVPLGYFLAESYQKAGQLDKAGTLYRELVEKAPTITGYRALVSIGRRAERPETLLAVLGEAAVHGVAPESFGDPGDSIADDAELVGALVEIARRRLEEAPDQFGFGPRLATALLALEAGQFDAADRFFDLAVQADADRAAETFLTWGLGLLAADQYGMAARVFQRGIDRKVLPEDNPVFYFYLAGALELDGRSEEALAAARKAAELDPQSPRFASRVAWILYRHDRHAEATAAYARLIEKFDAEFGSAEVRQVVRDARMVLSNLAVAAGDLAQAERWLEEVLDEFPDDIGALNDLGYLWADRGVHLERAERMIREAVAGDPQNAAYRDSLGWVLYRLGRFEDAIAELEKAAAGEQPPDPVILDHLGDAYHAAGQPERARTAWQRAAQTLEQQGDPEKAHAVRQKLKGCARSCLPEVPLSLWERAGPGSKTPRTGENFPHLDPLPEEDGGAFAAAIERSTDHFPFPTQ